MGKCSGEGGRGEDEDEREVFSEGAMGNGRKGGEGKA